MRLTQYINKVKTEQILVGYDKLERPVYEEHEIEVPVQCEIEHFSPDLALSELGLRVDVNFKVYTYINADIATADILRFKNKTFEVVAVLDYRRHNEILVRETV